MKVVLSTLGKFHTFDLARQLLNRGSLAAVFTAYPRWKLRGEGLPKEILRTFPWVHAPYMGLRFRRRLGPWLNREWEYWDRVSFGRYVARNLPESDLFVGLSSSGLEAGRVAKRRGQKYICDRGSTHIQFQDQILREEHERWGMRWRGIDPRIVEREIAEYELADLVTVPSTFNVESFVRQGVSVEKVRRVPYGVDLSRFRKVAEPRDGGFDVLFVGSVSLQKGVPYLLKAFQQVLHPSKRLTLVGSYEHDYVQWLQKQSLLGPDVSLVGHVPQHQLKGIMSRSHVMVLPSVQEGLAMVQGQALACGCPVIATTNTGAEDLYVDGGSGFIVPVRDVDALADRMQRIADDPGLRQAMSDSALRQVEGIGGWGQYGRQMSELMAELIGNGGGGRQ